MAHSKNISINDLRKKVRVPSERDEARTTDGTSMPGRTGRLVAGAMGLAWIAVAAVSYGQLSPGMAKSGYGIDDVTFQTSLINR